MSRTRRYGVGTIVCAALVVMSPHAIAHHDLGFTATPSPTTASAVADLATYVSFGNYIPKSSVTHFAPGALLAHAEDATSPVSPPPVNGDVVGSISASSDLWTNGCNGDEPQSYTLTWVEPIGTGAPAGAVARMDATGSFFGLNITKKAYVVWKGSGDSANASAHYDIVVPDMPDEITCSTSTPEQTTTGYGYARSGGSVTSRIVGKNPSTTGTKWSYYDFVDTANATHSDSDSFSVT
ncbi:MAG TPA: hypothetical protein VF519_14330 [Mycobacteriales bacterium]|jgi:hypothetical protein